MARVFSAIDIEDEDVLEELEYVRDQLDLGFRPVSRDKMHVTLEFFSDIEQEELESLENTIEELDIGPFQAEVAGLGAFPSEEYIRVVWAGVHAPELRELHQNVSDHAIESDSRHDFHPHVTLMRVDDLSREEKRKLRKTIESFRTHDFGTVTVDSVKLFESKISGKGSHYKELKEKKLT